MPGTCANCKCNGIYSICGRCKSTYYCNSKCQRADWKSHKLQCIKLQTRKQIIIPKPPNKPIDAQFKDRLKHGTVDTVAQFEEILDMTKGYISIKIQLYPSTSLIQKLTKILISHLTFWSLESLDIEFVPSNNSGKQIDEISISKLFYVLSKLPKLKTYRIDHIFRDPVSVQIQRHYFQSFTRHSYCSLTDLFVPIDDVFHSSFDYSAFLGYIKNSEHLRCIQIKLIYWVEEGNKWNFVKYQTAVNQIFRAILDRAESGRSFEEFKFCIDDIDEPIDTIDTVFANALLTYLKIVFMTTRDLTSLTISQRPFTKSKESVLWECIENHCTELKELMIFDREFEPKDKAYNDCGDILKMIGKLKHIEFIVLDDYIVWQPQTLKKFVNVINNHCKAIQFIRCGWIEFQSGNEEWKMLMDIFKCNHNASLLFFTPYKITINMIDNDTQSIICNAVLENIKNFNKYMVTIEKTLSFYFEGQMCVIQEMFRYLEDDEIEDKVIIALSGVMLMELPIRDRIYYMAAKITKYVNQQIASIKNQLSYMKTFQFEVN